MFHPSTAEVLCARKDFVVRRSGRFLVAELVTPHRVLSTSSCGGGQSEQVRFLVNHQSCEAAGHNERTDWISSIGSTAYHEQVCAELHLSVGEVALMSTAANMSYAVHRSMEFEDVTVDAIVTAGVHGNAARAGDPAQWKETEEGWQRVSPHEGTINTILLFNCPLTPAAQARAVVTMTEAKTAALLELAVPSRYSPMLATGTGTDQFCVASPLDETRKAKDSTSPHVKLGEILGRAVLDAMKEALRWQNGLEASYTRGIFHALGRFGLTEQRALDRLAQLLPEPAFTLLRKNQKAIFYEPGVAGAAYAFAEILDRIRFGTLPAGLAQDTLRQQAACIASALAARPLDWPAYWSELNTDSGDPVDLVLRAIALGWKSKWT